MITPETKAEIKRMFFAEHHTINAIATHLGIHHDTVQSALNTTTFNLRHHLRQSKLDAFGPVVASLLEKYPRIRASRVYQILKDRGFDGSHRSVRRRLRSIRPLYSGKAFADLTMYPGEQAQIDWGCFGKMRVGKAERRLSCFVCVLAYSRATYAVFTLDQSMESFLRGHTGAFFYLGGTPRVCLYDNLKSAVLERLGSQIRFNPTLLDFAGHYRFRPDACNPRSGNEKGRVERTIRYIRDNFWVGREFRDLDDANQQLRRWLDTVCNVRPWPQDRSKTVQTVWAEECKVLLPIAETPYPAAHVIAIRSGKIPFVRYDLNDYSIPCHLVGKPLTLIATQEEIEIQDDGQTVARHQRTWSRGEKIRDNTHFDAIWTERATTKAGHVRDNIILLIPQAQRLYEMMLEQGLGLGVQTTRLKKLINTYGIEEVRCAIDVAVERKNPRSNYIAQILSQWATTRKELPILPVVLPDRPAVQDLDVIHHDLSTYDALVGVCDGGNVATTTEGGNHE